MPAAVHLDQAAGAADDTIDSGAALAPQALQQLAFN